MRTSPSTILLCSFSFALAVGLAGCGCGGDAGSTGMHNGTDSTGTLNNGMGGNAASDGSAANGTNTGNGTQPTNGTNAQTAPGMERMQATTKLSGLRATLMAELESVRTRLNDGTRSTPATKADQDRAADLAQGLERLDRALAAIGASNDTTWTAIRTSSMQEVDDIKAWMAKNGMKVQG